MRMTAKGQVPWSLCSIVDTMQAQKSPAMRALSRLNVKSEISTSLTTGPAPVEAVDQRVLTVCTNGLSDRSARQAAADQSLRRVMRS